MRTAQPALAGRVAQRPDLGEGGFTLVEFMIAGLIMSIVLGGTIALATQIQKAYGTQLDDVAVEQEARFALDWIARDLRSAGSDPYGIILDNLEVWIDPNAGADANDSIRVRADINPPDNDWADDGEDVQITIQGVTPNMFITRQDANADDPAALAMTEAIFTDLSFTYLNAEHVATANSELVSYVQVQVTAQSRARNPNTLQFTTSTLSTEVRLRTR